jgi:hypothetical protein
MAAKMIGTSMPRTSHRGVLSNYASSLGAWKTSVTRYHKSSVFSRSMTAERPRAKRPFGLPEQCVLVDGWSLVAGS